MFNTVRAPLTAELLVESEALARVPVTGGPQAPDLATDGATVPAPREGGNHMVRFYRDRK